MIDEQYILGPNGEQMTEIAYSYGSGWSTSTWVHTNVVAGGVIATYLNDNISPHFRLTDWLGTTRAQTDNAGTLELTCQSLPFGDTSAQCAPATEQFYTGYERDAESGNDYAQARYYANSMGRFLSPDPIGMGAAEISNPQSFNLYSYVMNNPLTNTDPTGMECVWDDGSYDSEDDPDTGSPGQCQDQGGTWAELGQNGGWSATDANSQLQQQLQQAVANIQSGYWSSIAVTNPNGAVNYTFYTSGGRTVATDTGGLLKTYAYVPGDTNDKNALLSKSVPDPTGELGNWFYQRSGIPMPLDPNDQSLRIQQLSNQLDYWANHPFGKDLNQSMCNLATYGIGASTLAVGPSAAGATATAAYLSGGAAFLAQVFGICQ